MSRRADSFLGHAEFLEQWVPYIDQQMRKQVRRWGGAQRHYDDLRQTAYTEGWAGYQRWRALPDAERTEEAARLLVIISARDAVLEQWCGQTGTPRNSHARGAGAGAAIVRSSFAQLGGSRRSGESHEVAMARVMVAYHLVTEGRIHGARVADPESAMLTSDTRQRVLRHLIIGHYFEHRTFKELGEEIGITDSSKLCRMHFEALDILGRDLRDFASKRSARR